ncbi:MAG: YggT family protein [Desulfobacterales bacterium]|nr:YggT family protein [Desulfobacterales bacterium]MCP4162720.1 YggT family protein [Deltaproteobacteria bacterium]
MYVVGNFIGAFALILGIILDLYMYVVIARAVLSWVSPDPNNPIVQFINKITEPVLYRLRKMLPDLGGIDISPIIVIFIIMFLQSAVINSLKIFASSLH